MERRVAAAVAAIAEGRPVIVTDDPGRENEGDLVIAADAVSPESIAFMAVQCRGLICLAMTGNRVDELDLAPMAPGVAAETNFTVSIDLDVPGSTGISAADRARTIRRAVDGGVASDFRRPGHVFPLRAVAGGLAARRGHTEASVELCRLAGRRPAGVICEILNDDGTMARGADLERFAERHGLLIVSIAELADHRAGAPPALARPPVRVERVVETVLPTSVGRWRAIAFRSDDGLEHVALVLGSPSPDRPTLLRFHSECLTGDALGSERCDCGRQLGLSMEAINAAGEGVIVYIRGHEGRGIGLLPKLQAYALQDGGLDTVDANLELGFHADDRDYRSAVEVARQVGLRRVRLLTNNPDKLLCAGDGGLVVVERIPVTVAVSEDNIRYLDAKRDRMGHLLTAGGARSTA